MPNIEDCGDEFDVFLNFRGSDTRRGFTDHLYAALNRAGIRTFRDDDELERGESLHPQLEDAIKNSAISIIVFSPNYASSRWCLDELVTIIELKKRSVGHKVLPVFYHVDPTEVRYQRGSFQKAFDRHEQRADDSADEKTKIQILGKIEAWRSALREAADLSGMHLTTNNGYEATFINEIVCDIKKKLPMDLDLPKDLVGIDKQGESIVSWIRDGFANNNILVIWGIGGIGKTTIAEYAYNSNSRDFAASSYLANIGEFSSKPQDLLLFQRQLLLDLSGRKEKIRNCSEGIKMIKKVLLSKKADEKFLFLLDDVTEIEQLQALLEPLNVCPQRKIIVTTRDKSLLNGFEVKLHEVRCLGDDDALALFNSHAFLQDHPMEGYMKLSQEMIQRCGNLPLALKVLGSSLLKREIEEWEETLQKLNEVTDPNIQKVLSISYDSLLDDKTKKVFLRIACFFIGKNKDFAVKVLDPCDLYPRVAIKTLCDKCLIKINDMYNTLQMHQLIRDMAREIVRQQSPDEPGERNILWRDKDSFDVLQENTGTKAIEGLTLDMEHINQERYKMRFCHEEFSSTSELSQGDFNADAFSSMRNLAIVKLNHVRLVGSCERFSKRLVWVSWQNYPLESLPSDLTLNKLVVLDMKHSNLKRVWNGYKVLASLKILNLSYSLALEQTPDFNGLLGLEKLVLKGCTNLASVCESIGILKRLVLLNLKDCKNLRVIPSLPNSILQLKMSGCEGLGESKMKSQGEEELSFDNRIVTTVARPITTLGFLPRSIKELCLDGCNLSDDSFPLDGSWLASLTHLHIRENLITKLPDFVGSLPTIKSLMINNCPHLQSLVFPPSTLTFLNTSDSDSFKVLKLTPKCNTTRPSFQLWSTCLEELVGCFKLVPRWRVEEQVLKVLGLRSTMPVWKVLYEYGIYSSFVMGNIDEDVLSYGTNYLSWTKSGSSISIEIPFCYPKRNILGLNVCFTFTDGPFLWPPTVEVSVSNMTKDVTWIYELSYKFVLETYCDFQWLSMWKCEGFFQPGDQLNVTINMTQRTVMECGIRIVYENDLLDEDDTINIDQKESNRPCFDITNEQQQQQTNNTSLPPTHIRWTDKMLVEISDYCNCGTISKFVSDHHILFTEDDAKAYASEHQYFDSHESDRFSTNEVGPHVTTSEYFLLN